MPTDDEARTDDSRSTGPCTPAGAAVAIHLQAEDAEAMSSVFKALASPTRLQILDILTQANGQVCVCDIEAQFALSQPTISHHLKILRDAGLIASEQRGLWVYHRIRPERLAALHQFLQHLESASAD